jgi:hypothetical protein
MDSDRHQRLSGKFIQAIKESFDPCPLVGHKWFKTDPSGTDADFAFETRNLAKAMGMKPSLVAKIVLRRVRLENEGARARVSKDGDILLDFDAQTKPEPSAEPSE